MKRITTAVLILMSAQAWSEEPKPTPFLSKEREALFNDHIGNLAHAVVAIRADLELSIPDQRVLLHLPHRGFPNLAALVTYPEVTNFFGAMFARERNVRSRSFEESIMADVAVLTVETTICAQNNACFQLVKELAPTAEAMNLEREAGELRAKLIADPESESQMFDRLYEIRSLFDRLKDLPKLTPDEFAEERAQNAALALPERGFGRGDSRKTRFEWEFEWHQHWNHEGFLLAYSDSSSADLPQIVVNKRGGIFEWRVLEGMAYTHVPVVAFECKFQPSEFESIKKYLDTLPPSHTISERRHYIVSFEKDGRWETRVYEALPAGNPFETLGARMDRDARNEQGVGAPVYTGFLEALPKK